MARLPRGVEGFDRAAEEYERGRPDYPSDAVRWLVDRLPIRPGNRVVELASGTGKLTRALLPTGAAVVAVEPTPGMRRVLHRLLPSVDLLAGMAEAIPLADGCADAVVVGQAFHWFRVPAALEEIARVLRPHHALALVWNRRDATVPWMKALGEVLRAHEAKESTSGRSEAWKASISGDARFSPLESATLAYAPWSTPDALIARTLSVSFVALLPPEEKAAVADEIRAIIEGEPSIAHRPEFPVPYRTEVYATRRR